MIGLRSGARHNNKNALRLIGKTNQPAKALEPWLTDGPRAERPDPKFSFAYLQTVPPSRMISPRSFTGATRRRAPFSEHSCCHGTMLAWCSSQVIMTSSSL
jgi:hypothetical protein